MENAVLFAKFSIHRSRKYATQTSILYNGTSHKKYIEKRAVFPEGIPFVLSIYDKFVNLKNNYRNDLLAINICVPSDTDSILLEYIEGETLEAKLINCIQHNDKHAFFNWIDKYIKVLYNLAPIEPFTLSNDFEEIFGHTDLLVGQPAITIADIDIYFPNIIINDLWHLIDYEWTFFFPIPLEYIFYRSLLNFGCTEERRLKIVDWNVYEKYGLTPEKQALYMAMEMSFQKHVRGDGFSLFEEYSNFSPGVTFVANELDRIGHLENNLQQNTVEMENLCNKLEQQTTTINDYIKKFDEQAAIINDWEQKWQEQRSLTNIYEHTLQERNKLIQDMESTKVWKLYRKYIKLRYT